MSSRASAAVSVHGRGMVLVIFCILSGNQQIRAPYPIEFAGWRFYAAHASSEPRSRAQLQGAQWCRGGEARELRSNRGAGKVLGQAVVHVGHVKANRAACIVFCELESEVNGAIHAAREHLTMLIEHGAGVARLRYGNRWAMNDERYVDRWYA